MAHRILTSLVGIDATFSSTLSLTSLAGVGNRMLIVNSAGTVSTQAIPTGTVTSVATAGLISGGTITSSGTITTSMNTNKLVGRSTAGVGIMEEITVGSGLTLTGGTLTNTATPTPLGYYGAWQDDNTQSASANNTGVAMIIRTADMTPNGISIVNNGSGNPTRITFAYTGVYNLQFSSQFQNADNQLHDVNIWLRLNGTDVAGTNGIASIPNSHGGTPGHTIVAWNYLLNVVGGQYYEIYWSTDSYTNVTMQYYAAGNPPPSAASVILTVTQQSGIMAGTGITAINSLTGAVQTLGVATSGTDFNISSSGTAHTFNLPTASATNRGALSSADWTTFNNKQNALTNPITGTGTTNYLSKFTGSTALGNSVIYDDGTNIGIGTATPGYKLDVNGTGRFIGTSNQITAYYDASNYMQLQHNSISVANTALLFNVNSAERMRLLSTGNLLIGITTDAGYKLYVNGTAYINGSLSLSNGMIFGLDGSTTRLFNSGQINYQSNSTSGTQHNFTNQVGYNTGTIVNVYSGGSTNTATTGTMQVVSINGRLAYTSGNAEYNALSISTAPENAGTYTGTIRGIYYNPSSIIGTGFIHRAIETVTGDIYFASTSGNVGIGTAPTSTYKLDVNGNGIRTSSTVGANLTINETGGNIGDVASLYLYGNNGGWGGSIRYNVGAGGANNRVDFYTGVVRSFSISYAANLLVGTTTDSGYKLDVAGTARVQSSITWGSTNGGRLTFSGSDAYIDAALSGGSLYFRTNGSTNAMLLSSTGVATINNLSGTGTRMVVADSSGVLSTQSIPTGTVTGTGTSGQVTYWNGTSSITGDNTFTYTPTSQHLINNSVTASGAIARGINLTSTLTAAANSDVLVGLDINNTFTNGAYTGLSNYSIRTYNKYKFETLSDLAHGLYWSPANDGTTLKIYGSNYSGGMGYLQLNVLSGGDGMAVNGSSHSLNINAAQTSINLNLTNITFNTHGTGEAMRIVNATKNVLIGTTTDAGQKLQITGNQATTIAGTGDGFNLTRTGNYNNTTLTTLATITDTTANANQAKTGLYVNIANASTNIAIQTVGSVGVGATPSQNSFSFVSGYISYLLAGATVNSAANYNLNVRSTVSSYAAGNGGGLSFWGDDRAQAGANTAFAGIRGVKENSTYLNGLGALTFLTQASTSGLSTESTFAEVGRFTSGGNFGVGTTSPAGKLDVNGTAIVRGQITYTEAYTGATTSRIGLFLNDGNLSYSNSENWVLWGTNAGANSAGIKAVWLGNNGYEMGLTFHTATGGNGAYSWPGGSEVMRLLNNKNVLIGASGGSGDSGYKLHVVNNGYYTAANGSLNAGNTLYVKNSGNVLIGTNTDSGYKLDVIGDSRIKGSGSTSGTTTFRVENSSGGSPFTILGDGTVNMGFNANLTYNMSARGYGSNGGYGAVGVYLYSQYYGNASGTAATIQYSGSPAGVTSNGLVIGGGFALQSATYNALAVNQSYTGLGTNTLVGYLFDPTLDATFPANNIISIKTTKGNVQLCTSSGNVLIGSTSNNGNKLQVNGGVTISTNLTINASSNNGFNLDVEGTASFLETVVQNYSVNNNAIGSITSFQSKDNLNYNFQNGSYNGETISGVLASNVQAGQILFLRQSALAWDLADATTTGKSISMLGIACSNGSAGSTITILLNGFFASISYFSATTMYGVPMYLHTTGGQGNTTAPSSTGNVVRVIGHVYDWGNTNSCVVLRFNPDNFWLVI
jgi:hypothetical protein